MIMNESEKSLKLFIVLSRAYKVVNEQVNGFIQTSGLNPTEFAVLELLYHKGPQPLQQIGGKILLASGSITYVVDKLEKKQLLKRVACPHDRRITHAAITERGTELIERIFPEHEQNIHELVRVLSEEEIEQATAILRKLGLSIKNLS
ncbi:MarR family winged helix-turn-helix transcriptional regulator [Domibacillus robiginosus]|uniref:MarR family winged helix-turn-helix transcriptional regulator n=1 Tax=Domibacillus robiginosus TaxID=1071054 RepID=UPI00067D2D2A|nr:MarR family transcriptional regulator [Domibacillus robiginosus]